jgi:hypothetical protein
MERRRRMKRAILGIALVCLLLAACGGGKTYLVDLEYVPQTPPYLKAKPATIAVAPFIDKRSSTNDVGIRKKLDGTVDRYTTAPSSLSEGIKKAVEDFLRANGFNLVETEVWDLRPESLSRINADMVVGGQIRRFWSQAESLAGRTIIRTDLEIAFYLGKPWEGSVLRQTIEMSGENTQIVFSWGKIEEILNETLSEMIETAFEKLLARAKTRGSPLF